jgi:pimeloyl-ACP methyl ester carboxylesterase
MHVPVVYIHGFIGHLRQPALLRGLEPDRVLFPDLLGYGSFGRFAPSDRTTINLPGQVGHLRRMIQAAFGDEPVFLIGHSTGAAVALLYAHRFGASVAGIVSAEGNLSGADAFLSARLAAKSPSELEHWLADARCLPENWMHFERVKITPESKRLLIEWLDHQPGHVIRAMARSVVAETFSPHYGDLVARVMADIPTHLVMGARSQSISEVPPRFRGVAASFSVIPDASHLMMIDAPDAFQTIVLDRLQAAAVPAGAAAQGTLATTSFPRGMD